MVLRTMLRCNNTFAATAHLDASHSHLGLLAHEVSLCYVAPHLTQRILIPPSRPIWLALLPHS